MKTLLGVLALALLATGAGATTRTAATCNLTDVQTQVTASAGGDTVLIPAGSCTWTNGITLSGKGITVTGAGSGRIIAISTTTLTLGTGSKTLTIAADNVAGTLPTITVGQTLQIQELGAQANFMTGTVTSISGTTLVMSITSEGGACGSNGSGDGVSNCARWTIATPFTTQIINNSTSNPLWSVTLDTSIHDNFSGVYYIGGTAQSHIFYIQPNTGGKAPLIHNNRFTANPNLPGGSDSNRDVVNFTTNEGVVYNNTFDCVQFNVAAVGGVTTKEVSDNGSWESVANWGSADTTGQTAIYVETNDFHAFGFAVANDDNGRLVTRYNFFNNSGMMGTHGADTSPFGQRYFELYNNVGIFNGYSNGSTFNMNNWGYLRGGTGIIFDNTMPALQSQDYGSKDDFDLTVQNLQRNEGPDPCWGAGTSGGAEYHAPRQVGFGYVTGLGTDGLGRTRDANAYVGDLEPIYIWGNSRAPLITGTPDYGSGNSDSCTGSTYDTNANYIHTSRDWYPNTAKPSYTPATYPSILISGLTSTSTVLTSSNYTPVTGTNVTLTATLTPSSGPSGTVTFYDSGTSIGTGTVSSGIATFAVTAITGGVHSYTAVYSGDSTYATSTSPAITVTATTATSTVLTSSNYAPATGTNITLTATITPSSGPTGTVAFFDGGTGLGTGTVSAGVATHAVIAITAGAHTYTATYSGDSSYATSTSSPITVTASTISAGTAHLSGGVVASKGVVIK